MKSTSIGQNVKKRRILLGLSQEALAEKAGISLRTIQRIEKDETTPRGETLKLLATALGTSPDELIDWQEREDKSALTILNLSMLSFLLFSLLGIIVPLVLWISQKDTVRGVRSLGKKILNFQITLTLIVFVVQIISMVGIFAKLNHFHEMPEMLSPAFISNGITVSMWSSIVGVLGAKIYCVIVVLINASRIPKDQEVWYKPAIPFLR